MQMESAFAELQRVASFRDCKFQAPADRAYACRLARRGFVVLPDKRITCTHCGQEVPVSEAVTEDLLERHRRLCPDCPGFSVDKQIQRSSSPRTIHEGFKRKLQQRLEQSRNEDLTTDGEQDDSSQRFLDLLQSSVQRASQAQVHEVPPPPTSIVIDRLEPDYEVLRAYNVRLSTFHDFPENMPVKKEDVAKAGFFYTGQSDRVQCAFCRNYLKNWARGDVPMDEHKKHFKECRFVKGLDQGTMEADRAMGCSNPQRIVQGLSLREHNLSAIANPQRGRKVKRVSRCDLPKYPNYAEESKRVESFMGKQKPEGQNVNVLANAGYYYIGPEDKVQCFYCGGSLNHWSALEEPWVEHATYFPRCGFLRSKRDPGYIGVIQDSYQATLKEFEKNSSAECNEVALAEKRVSEAMRSTAVTAVMEMGYTAKSIKQAIRQRFASTGQDFANAESLVEALTNPEASVSASTSPGHYEPSSAMGSDMAQAAAMESDDVSVVQEILSENKRLWDIKTCKVCLDEEVNVVFLPCGHLACCNSCSPSLRNCAICRAVIRGTVRVFLH